MNKKYNRYLQGYRAVACMMVFLGHALGMYAGISGISINNSFIHLLYDGSIAVKMFWVLGGYLAVKSFREPSVRNYIFYVIKKIMRVYPTYIISIIFATILCNFQLNYDIGLESTWCGSFWNSKIGLTEIIRQLVFRCNFNLINPPTWTMKYEVWMIFVLPLIISIVKGRNNKLLWGVCIFVTGLILGIFFSNIRASSTSYIRIRCDAGYM